MIILCSYQMNIENYVKNTYKKYIEKIFKIKFYKIILENNNKNQKINKNLKN